MEYINPPKVSIANVTHKTFYSQLYNHEIGYNIYIPSDCLPNHIAYHFHGWTGSESSEIVTMEKVYRNRQAITVFPNCSPVIEDMGKFPNENLPVESMLINEFMPYIESEYITEYKSVSGFSMGGGMAFYYAVKHPDLFDSVTAYAGTYHHYYHKDSHTVGEPNESAVELYESMMAEKRYLEDGNILCVIRKNADRIRDKLQIKLHIGSDDVLFCDNEILHLYLNSLDIPHEYIIFDGAEHELERIL